MRKFFYLLLLFPIAMFGEYTLHDGKLVPTKQVALRPVQEHHSRVLKAYEKKDWNLLEKETLIVIKNFPKTSFSREAIYYLGVAYFERQDYDMANFQFTDYLTCHATPKYFEEAIQYKFEIAEHFRSGARKHLMGFKSMPKWSSAGKDAIKIYDEVISALPNNDMAAQALFGKAEILAKQKDYRAGIEAFQALIRRFPKHPLSIESYIGIGNIYFAQSKSEYPDPDYLDLAELNLRKFRASFPNEEKWEIAQQNFQEMKNYYAGSLFETAKFYEKTKKLGAAKIYYQKILKSYPDSQFTETCTNRIEIIEAKLAAIEAKKSKKK